MLSPVNKRKLEAAIQAKTFFAGTAYRRTRPDEDGGRTQRLEVRFDGIAGCLRTPNGGSSRQTVIIVEHGKVRSRLMTIRECARLMGAPDWYELTGSYNDGYRAMGDAVAVPVTRWLTRHLLAPLAKRNSQILVEQPIPTMCEIDNLSGRTQNRDVAWMPEAPKFGAPPTSLDFEKSLMFFHAYMYGPLQGKLRLYGARGIPQGSVAMSSDWEVFASMLVNDMGRKFGDGVDLTHYEVKSAKHGGSYEYQYHKHTGLEKLAKDKEVGHLFFEYHDNLKQVDLRYLHGTDLSEFFTRWLDEYPNPYPQRYRKNIPYDHVKHHGKLLMSLRDGEVVFPVMISEETPTSLAVEIGESDRGEE
jgi:hypothetical protein